MTPRGTEGPLNLELVESQQLPETPEDLARLPRMFRHFAGAGYRTEADHERLELQHERIFKLMVDGWWRTLDEIHEVTGDPQASISAQLRHLTKQAYGGHTKNRRERSPGLYEYQIICNPKRKDAFARWLRDEARKEFTRGKNS